MRILKALAAVLAGILLLALPAVAMPQKHNDPNCTKAESADSSGSTDSNSTDQSGNSTDTAPTSDTTSSTGKGQCVPEQPKTNALDQLLGAIAGNGSPLGH
jgi:uncharacterized low-complexity protein